MSVGLAELGYAPKPPEVRQTPVAIPEITLIPGEPVSLDITRDNVGLPISAGMLKLAEIVGPERWRNLTKSTTTPGNIGDLRTSLLTFPLSDGAQTTEWNEHNWRVSRHYADDAFTKVETHNSHGMRMREMQAGFAQHLNRFVLGIPEGEEETRDLLRALLEVGTSGDWEENPNLAREVANAYWDVGERVLESWTTQPARQN